MRPEEAELRRISLELEGLALLRLDGPLTHEQATRYRRLCDREWELLGVGLGSGHAS